MNNTVLYAITVLIWGSTWIVINFQLGKVAPEASLTYRFGFAAIVLFIFCLIKNKPLRFTSKEHFQFFFFGVTLFGINYFLLYNSQQYISSALTCIAFSTLLFANIINARIWFKTPINAQVYFGGVLGILGITTLFWPQVLDAELGANTVTGLLLCIVGTLFASAGNMLSMQNQKLKLPLFPATAWGMFYGASFMAAITLLQGKSFTFDYSFSYVSSLLYLSIFGSVIAFGCYLTLLNNIGAHKASYATIMFPAVAVIISTFVENFEWSAYTILGLGLIFAGNLVVLAKPKQGKDGSEECKNKPDLNTITNEKLAIEN